MKNTGLKIGDRFEYQGVELEVQECYYVKQYRCTSCYFNTHAFDCWENGSPECQGEKRFDHKDVIFKQVGV